MTECTLKGWRNQCPYLFILSFCPKFRSASNPHFQLLMLSKTSVPLQQSLRNLDKAYKNFFESRNGKRKGQKLGLPKFKKKTNNQSAEFTKAAFSVTGESIYLAKIGMVKPVWSRKLPSEPSSVTVVKDCANRYFLSFVVDVEPGVGSAERDDLQLFVATVVEKP